MTAADEIFADMVRSAWDTCPYTTGAAPIRSAATTTVGQAVREENNGWLARLQIRAEMEPIQCPANVAHQTLGVGYDLWQRFLAA